MPPFASDFNVVVDWLTSSGPYSTFDIEATLLRRSLEIPVDAPADKSDLVFSGAFSYGKPSRSEAPGTLVGVLQGDVLPGPNRVPPTAIVYILLGAPVSLTIILGGAGVQPGLAVDSPTFDVSVKTPSSRIFSVYICYEDPSYRYELMMLNTGHLKKPPWHWKWSCRAGKRRVLISA